MAQGKVWGLSSEARNEVESVGGKEKPRSAGRVPKSGVLGTLGIQVTRQVRHTVWEKIQVPPRMPLVYNRAVEYPRPKGVSRPGKPIKKRRFHSLW